MSRGKAGHDDDSVRAGTAAAVVVGTPEHSQPEQDTTDEAQAVPTPLPWQALASKGDPYLCYSPRLPLVP